MRSQNLLYSFQKGFLLVLGRLYAIQRGEFASTLRGYFCNLKPIPFLPIVQKQTTRYLLKNYLTPLQIMSIKASPLIQPFNISIYHSFSYLSSKTAIHIFFQELFEPASNYGYNSLSPLDNNNNHIYLSIHLYSIMISIFSRNYLSQPQIMDIIASHLSIRSQCLTGRII